MSIQSRISKNHAHRRIAKSFFLFLGTIFVEIECELGKKDEPILIEKIFSTTVVTQVRTVRKRRTEMALSLTDNADLPV